MSARLLVGPFASGKSAEVRRRAGEAGARVVRSLAEMRQHDGAVALVDDADELPEGELDQLLELAEARGTRVFATSKVWLPRFAEVEIRSRAFLPEMQQRLISLIFGQYQRVQLSAHPSVQLVPMKRPVTDAAAAAGALQLLERIDGGTACLGGCPGPLRSALRRWCPELVFCATAAEYAGRRWASVVACCFEPVPSQELLELLSRADVRLTVAFDSQRPPEAFAHAGPKLLPLMPKGSPWINWEGFAVSAEPVRKRKRKRGGVEQVQPKTVTALVRHLAGLCKQRGACGPEQALALAAEELGWAAVPRHTAVSPSADAIVERCDAVHGVAAELIMLRELALVEPCTPNIVLPDAVRRLKSAVFVDDLRFVEAWWAEPRLHTISQSAAAWAELLADGGKWGERPPGLCAAIAAAPLPIAVLPASWRELRPQVDQAAAAYIDPTAVSVPDWVVLTLAAAVRCVDQGHREPPPPVGRASCELRRLAQRARHFWARSGTRYVQDQVPLRTADGFKGFCDFTLNGSAVLELKCSVAEDTTFTANVLWTLQAAIYAHALKLPTAYVFNVNRNQIARVQFDPNLLE